MGDPSAHDSHDEKTELSQGERERERERKVIIPSPPRLHRAARVSRCYSVLVPHPWSQPCCFPYESSLCLLKSSFEKRSAE